jgi:hypothetical protein
MFENNPLKSAEGFIQYCKNIYRNGVPDIIRSVPWQKNTAMLRLIIKEIAIAVSKNTSAG